MTERTIFPDDLVVGRTRNGKYMFKMFAVVEHVAGIEDSDDDSSDSEFADFKPTPLERGFIRVTWYPDGKDEVVQESQVQLVDRSCLARDVVRRQGGEQLGTAISTNVMCDVTIIGTSKTLKGINVADLKTLMPLTAEDQVAFGPWLGSIRNTQEMLLLRFSNGARAKLDVERDGCEHLMDLYPHPSDEGGFSMDAFYPGQYLCGPAKAFAAIQWVSGAKIKFKPKIKYRVLIEQIELYGVKVKWASRAFNDKKPSDVYNKEEPERAEKKEAKTEDIGSSVDPEPEPKGDTMNVINEAEPPASVIIKEDLKKFHRLAHFWHGHVCLGERLRYKLTEEDAEKLNKQKNKSMQKTKMLRLANRMDQKLLHGCHLVTALKRKKSSLRNKRQQATQHDSASDSPSENDDSAYDEEDLEDVGDDTSSPAPSAGACASVARDAGEIDVNVNTESDIDLSSPTGVKPTILGTLLCRAAGFELGICLVQVTVGVVAKRLFQCNIQNPECSKETMENMRCRFMVFVKAMMRKNQDTVNMSTAACASVLQQCPYAIRRFMMQQSPSLGNQEILFEYTMNGKKTSGMIDKDGKKTEVEYSDEGEIVLQDPERIVGDFIGDNPVSDFVLNSGPPAKRQAGPNVHYHPGQWLAVEVTRTYTKADVQWQDGTIDCEIQASNLFPAHHVDDNDFCPGDFVVDKRVPEERGSYGVVMKADSKSRMTKIQWIREGRTSDIEEVSVYEVADHPEFRFRISDVIVRVGTNYSDESAENIDICQQGIGELLRVTEFGMLRVIWTDGSVSLVHPQDVIAFNDENESLFESSEEIDDFDSDASWITASTEDEADLPHEDNSRTTLDSEPSLTGDTGIPRPIKNGIDSSHISHERGEGSHGPVHEHPENHDDDTAAHESGNETTDGDDSGPGGGIREQPHQHHDDVGAAHKVESHEHLGTHQHHDDVAGAHEMESKECMEIHDDDDAATEPAGSQTHEHHGDVGEQPHEIHGDMETDEVAESSRSPLETKSEESTSSSETTAGKDASFQDLASGQVTQEAEQPTDEAPSVRISSASSTSLSEADSNSAFSMVSTVPSTHQFVKRWFQETTSKTFMRAVQRDLKLLRTSLSPGITVKAYEDRMDLLSVLISGPDRTPYQDGVFVFDVYLPQDYPNSPPTVHYVSYSPRLNPNLYETGRVCVSLLGTWSGKGSERWTKDSTLLQVLLSIQGLILNSEPYYNEAGYEGHRGTAEGMKNSRCYNEMVILRLVQHMTALIQNPPEAFVEEVHKFCIDHIPLLLSRISSLLGDVKSDEETDESSKHDNAESMDSEPDTKNAGYPLLPLSKGVMLSLSSRLRELEAAAKVMNYV